MQKKLNPLVVSLRHKKKLLAVISFVLMGTLIILARFCVLLPDHFSPKMLTQNIKKEFFIDPNLERDTCSELSSIVSHPLRYLGKGSQAIAFVSADGNYILKFFLNERFHTKLRIRSPFKKATPTRIRFDVLERYAKAFEEIKEETGLIGIHLSANTTELPHCILKDPKGKQHLIDLNQFSFLIQKRCDCIDKTFKKMSLEEKQYAIKALETLTISLAEKGFYNLRDSFKDENFAMLDGKAYIIDIGNVVFSSSQKENPKQECERAKHILKSWLKENKL